MPCPYPDRSGVVVGCGFLVGHGHVMTCAHVVARALGNCEDKILSGDNGNVVVDFPLVHGDLRVHGRVEVWQQIQPDGTGDVAVLALTGDLPARPSTPCLVAWDDLWGHSFRVFGFPRHYDHGVWAAGVLRARQATGWVQMEGSGPGGYVVEAGFSGAPVWDDDLGGVVGMAVAADARPDTKAAYLIPTDTLASAWPSIAERAVPPSPYRGLSAFRERDAAVFFGREELTDRLVTQAERRPLVAVVGPSGSGKSSVVFAGLLPKLHAQGWMSVTMRPSHGSSPLAALAASLLPHLEPDRTETERLAGLSRLMQTLADGHLSDVIQRILRLSGKSALLLVMDQFEELFSAEKAEAAGFIDGVFERRGPGAADHGILTAVLTLRADFLGTALESPTLASALEGSVTTIGQMSREQFRSVIEGPLPEGVDYEPGLIERILEDVGSDAGSLPLLQFALTVLWEHQDQGRLTHRAYELMGGVDGALVSYAETVFLEELRPSEHDEARRLLVQLVRPSDVGQPVRRVARRSELNDSRWELGQRLAATRLLVADRDPTGVESVELAHEALIDRWSRLSQWVQEDYSFRTWQERVRRDSTDWVRMGQESGALLRGTRLSEAERWLAERSEDVAPGEREFVEASREHRDWYVRRLRTTVAVLSMLLLVAMSLGVVSWTLFRSVDEQRRIGQSRDLADQAEELASTRPDAAMLLAAAAFNVEDTAEARRTLMGIIEPRRQFHWLISPEVGEIADLQFDPNPRKGNILAVAGNRRVQLMDLRTGESLSYLPGDVRQVAFSPDGTAIALEEEAVHGRLEVSIWYPEAKPREEIFDRPTERTVFELGSEGPTREEGQLGVEGLTFGPDGTVVAGCLGDELKVWAVHGPARTLPAPKIDGSSCSFGFLSQDTLLYGDGRDSVVWDIFKGQQVSRRRAINEHGHPSVAVSPDGTWVLLSDGVDVRKWDPVLASLSPNPPLLSGVGNFSSASFSADGRRVLLDNRYSLTLVDVSGGTPPLPFDAGRNAEHVGSSTLSADGRTIAVADGGRLIGLISTDRRAAGNTGVLSRSYGQVSVVEPVKALAVHRDGRHVSTVLHDGEAMILGLNDGTRDNVTRRDPVAEPVDAVDALDSSGRFYAAGRESDASVTVTDLLHPDTPRAQLTGVQGLRQLAIAENGAWVLSADDKGIRLWDVSEQRDVWAASSSWGPTIAALAVSPDGRHVAATSTDGEARLWDRSTDTYPHGEILQSSDVTSVAFSRYGRRLAVGTSSGVRIWNVEAGAFEEATVPTGAYRVAFSPNGRVLAVEAGRSGGTLEVWELPDGDAEEPVLISYIGGITAFAFFPNSQGVVTATYGGVFWHGFPHPDSYVKLVCELAGADSSQWEWKSAWEWKSLVSTDKLVAGLPAPC